MRSSMIHLSGLLASSLLCSGNPDDQVAANIDYGSFKSPSAIVRPRFRYWLPDASVDPDIVQQNIKSAGSIGAGGVEFLPFYNYGGQAGGVPPGADWSKYGFGTDAFKNVFLAALKAHKEAGLGMDFAFGPNQGQGVPAESDNEGLMWDLVRLPHLASKQLTRRPHSPPRCRRTVCSTASFPVGGPESWSPWCRRRLSPRRTSVFPHQPLPYLLPRTLTPG